jgi:hypothetical protein
MKFSTDNLAKPTNRYHREIDLVRWACRVLKTQRHVSLCRDVPLLGRCIDLVYIDRQIVTSVEFKLTDWRRALLQARDHRLAVDYSYVCMPSRTITDRISQETTAAGVGLVFPSRRPGWPFETVIEAPASCEVWSTARIGLIEYVLRYREGSK